MSSPPAEDASYRPVEPSDASGLVPLLDLLGYPATTTEVHDRLVRMADDAAVVLGAFVDDGLVAYTAGRLILTVERDEPVVQVIGLATLPSHGGRGLGSTLLAKLETWARERDAGLVVLNSGARRAGAQTFYRSRGYSATGLRFVKHLT